MPAKKTCAIPFARCIPEWEHPGRRCRKERAESIFKRGEDKDAHVGLLKMNFGEPGHKRLFIKFLPRYES